ncbi:MAG TPA: SUMF1/EgtB/PvdO family nonheme iron enzyme [Bryobacteraceae bacterium]|nr:SUMF1/EgtB/PvdO family nonheme iron enzyme [Bryobacteraceae bacterium]
MSAIAAAALGFVVSRRAPAGVPEILIPLGHAGQVYSLQWSPDGKRLASAGADATVKVWEPATGSLLRSMAGHNESVVFAGWDAAGKELATDGPNRGISLWHAGTGALDRVIARNSDTILRLAWSPDRTMFAAIVDAKDGSRSDPLARIWKADTGEIIATVGDYTDTLHDIAWSPDSKTVAAGGTSLKLYEASTGTLVRVLRKETTGIFYDHLAFSPDGIRLAEAGSGNLNLWKVDAGKIEWEVFQRDHYFSSLAFSPDGKTLATGGQDIRQWQTGSGALLRTFGGQKDCVCAMAWSPDGQTIAANGDGGTVRLWRADSGTVSRDLGTHPNSVYSLAWSPDGRTLASGAYDHTVKLWDVNSGGLAKTLAGHVGEVFSVAWSPDGRAIASGSRDRTAKIWDTSSGALLHTLAGKESGVPEQLGYGVPNTVTLAWRPDGQTIAAAGFDDRRVKLWQPATGALLRDLETPTLGIYSLSWSPDGATLASGGGYIQIWSRDGTLLSELFLRQSVPSRMVAYGPDGKTLASVGFDPQADLLPVSGLGGSDTEDLKQGLAGHAVKRPPIQKKTFSYPAKARAAAWSPDGKWFATGHDDGMVRLWHGDTGAPAAQFAGHAGYVEALAWSPDSQTLASGGDDATIRLWHVANGELESVTTLLPGNDWITMLPKNMLFDASPGGDAYGEVRVDSRTRFSLASPAYRAALKRAGVRRLMAEPRPVLKPDYGTIARGILHEDRKAVWGWLLLCAVGAIRIAIPRRPLGRWLVCSGFVAVSLAIAGYWSGTRLPPATPTPSAPPTPVTKRTPPGAEEAARPPKINPRDGLRYVWIPAGDFQMGCLPGDDHCPGEDTYGGLHDEGHGFTVHITRGYWMGETPVTVGAFQRFMKATGLNMPPEPEHFVNFNPGWADKLQPIVNVTWNDANGFCEWAGMRLPTEAEWEKAARGGSPAPRYGDIDEIAWHRLNSEDKDGTRRVGLKKPNAFGLYDMLGNVREWTADWFGVDYYATGNRTDPEGPFEGRERIVRGASYISDAEVYVRASTRYSMPPGEKLPDVGFRCAGK